MPKVHTLPPMKAIDDTDSWTRQEAKEIPSLEKKAQRGGLSIIRFASDDHGYLVICKILNEPGGDGVLGYFSRRAHPNGSVEWIPEPGMKRISWVAVGQESSQIH